MTLIAWAFLAVILMALLCITMALVMARQAMEVHRLTKTLEVALYPLQYEAQEDAAEEAPKPTLPSFKGMFDGPENH